VECILRITVASDDCIGSGQCVIACGDIFSQDNDGVVVVLNSGPPDELHAAVHEAVNICPAACIRFEDDGMSQ
jgi:ferredoxin